MNCEVVLAVAFMGNICLLGDDKLSPANFINHVAEVRSNSYNGLALV